MGLPEQGAPGNIAEPFHAGLQPQQQQAARTGFSPEQALPDDAGGEQAPEAEQHSAAGHEKAQGMGGQEAVAETDQYGHQHPAGDPGPVLGVLHRHGVGDRVDLQAPFPRQDSQPDGGAHHRVDEQDHQNGVDQPKPVVAGERLQCQGISQNKTQP